MLRQRSRSTRIVSCCVPISSHEGRITIDFKGKANARQLTRHVRPRILRTIKKYSAGGEADRARNLVIEGGRAARGEGGGP